MIYHTNNVQDKALREALWTLSQKVFIPICEETPINQFYPKDMFDEYLQNSDIMKCIAFAGDVPCGYGFITQNIELEPILNPYYFRKHYPDTEVYLVMLICVDQDFRDEPYGPELIRELLSYVPQDAIGIFVHSDQHNALIPRFGRIATRGRMHGGQIDAETCWIYRWTKPRGLPLRTMHAVEEELCSIP